MFVWFVFNFLFLVVPRWRGVGGWTFPPLAVGHFSIPLIPRQRGTQPHYRLLCLSHGTPRI